MKKTIGARNLFLALGLFIVVAVVSLAPAANSYIKNLPLTSTGEKTIIAIERWPCFGACPVYTATIYGSGLVVYDGEFSVDVKGKRIKFLDEKEIDSILVAFEKADFFSLKDSYSFPATDLPATIITIEIDGRNKKIRHYGGGCDTEFDVAPQELCILEQKIDEILEIENWVGSKK